MKILWVINVMLPELAINLNQNYSYSGGWMHQFKNSISQNNDLTICCFDTKVKYLIKRKIEKITYYVIPKKSSNPSVYDKAIESYLLDIYKNEKCEIVHIWGTEYPHTLSALKVAKELKIKSVVSIQGMIFDCARHYTDFLPKYLKYKFTIRDFIRRDNLLIQENKFRKRGKYEIESLLTTRNVIGRTSYDYSCSKEINNKLNYYFCNECLRMSFYTSIWSLSNVEKDTIFISQASYPIKGFHVFLDALNILKSYKPNIKVYVAGGFNPMSDSCISDIKKDTFTKYIKRKITLLQLENNLFFLGNLDEQRMKEQLLRSHVFVSPSLIENSSNSVGEAMLLGVPVVSSYVGGVGDMIDDKKSGFLYPPNQPNMLAQFVLKILDNDSVALELSKNARERAKKLFDIEINTKSLWSIYEDILNHNK